MLFKWEIESSGTDPNRSNWILSQYGIFFIIFFETIYVVTLMKKSIWEITNALVCSVLENYELTHYDYSYANRQYRQRATVF